MPEDRWTKVKEFVAEWFEPLGDGDGYSEEEIAAAEARLGIRLPGALREWYGFAGRWYKKIEVQNELLSPDKLFFEGRYLVFLEKSQYICTWAIRCQDISQENPPVYDKNSRKLEADKTTDFLFQSLCNEIELGIGIENNADGSPRIAYSKGLQDEVRQCLSTRE